jgi:hypothetical protein
VIERAPVHIGIFSMRAHRTRELAAGVESTRRALAMRLKATP